VGLKLAIKFGRHREVEDAFVIHKSQPLKGKIKINGSKNAVLPIMAASLLSSGRSIIEGVPLLDDMRVMMKMLQHFGARLKLSGSVLYIDMGDLVSYQAPYELIKKMRASFLVMGPILARLGRIRISMPGGCAIGARPIDLHLKGLAAMGAEISNDKGFIEARADRLKGAKIYLDFPSVGATENIMMAATLADGCTVISNAAEEPEIVDLANFLNAMGACVTGAGTDTIKIEGVKELRGTKHCVIPDRIEACTFMVAAAITGGDIIIDNVISEHIMAVQAKLEEMGVQIIEQEDSIRVVGNRAYKPVDIKTLPYPGFPTDMQAQMMSLLAVTPGTSIIIETVFENRFMHVNELRQMGANIRIDGNMAVIEGVQSLHGSEVKATDLRAGAALILAGLIAEDETVVTDIYHVDRGYMNLEDQLRELGADIERVKISHVKSAVSII
jgi:UDP-N-acetylglucosamine 1-carboxyvinyltransferase